MESEKLKGFFEKYFGIGGSSAFAESETVTDGQGNLAMVAEAKTLYVDSPQK